MPTRILIVCTSFQSKDGIGNLCRTRVKGLLQAGYSVTVLTHSAEIWDDCSAAPLMHLVPPDDGAEAYVAVRDLVQAAELTVLDFGFPSKLHAVLRTSQVPLVVAYHGLTPHITVVDAMYAAIYWQSVSELRSLPRPALVVTESSSMYQEYVQLGGCPSVPHRVISGFGKTLAASPQAAQLFETSSLKLLCVGRVFPNKNLQVACQAVTRLASEGIDATLDIVGSSEDAVARRYRESLGKLADKSRGKIKFWGRVSQEHLDQLYRDCSAVVIPSLHEGFSLPAVEALMHGKPVFASNLAALPETLGDAAIFFNPLSPLDLIKKLKEFRKLSVEQQADLQSKALRRAGELSEDAFIKNSISVVESVLQQSKALPRQESSLVVELVPDDLSKEAQVAVEVAWSDDTGVAGTLLFHVNSVTAAYRLRASSFRGLLVDSLSNPIRYTTHRDGAMIKFEFNVPAASLANATKLQLNLLNEDQDSLCCELPAVLITLPSNRETSTAKDELAALRETLHQCFATREIRLPHSASLFARLRCRIANKFLELVHRSFIAPQTAFLEALISYLEKSRHRD